MHKYEKLIGKACRCEFLYGDGVRNPAKVFAYETNVLGNVDILNYAIAVLSESFPSLCEKLSSYVHEILDNGYVDDFSIEDWEIEMDEVVKAFGKYYHRKINYCIWLASPDAVMYGYGKGKIKEEDILIYDITENNQPPAILSDIGQGGCLYGFYSEPKAVCTLEKIP